MNLNDIPKANVVITAILASASLIVFFATLNPLYAAETLMCGGLILFIAVYAIEELVNGQMDSLPAAAIVAFQATFVGINLMFIDLFDELSVANIIVTVAPILGCAILAAWRARRAGDPTPFIVLTFEALVGPIGIVVSTLRRLWEWAASKDEAETAAA